MAKTQTPRSAGKPPAKSAAGPSARPAGKAGRPSRRTPELTDDDNWDARLGFLMHDVSRLRRNVFDEFMKPVGLTRSQWWILAYLSRRDGMIQTDLANVLDLGKAALGGLIDRLEAAGFIQRRLDDSDRRVRRIYMSARGKKMCDEMRTRSHAMSERMLEGLSFKDRHALAASLAIVKKNLLEMKGGDQGANQGATRS